ncbi:LysM peptidoglycan-binding domain-containing protein [Streptomyces sp. A1136]|uniref:LysM peptidoglycan-binding domain-containing protein n=1 Tax=Streptomyces sp. A1136 TaxID=2563102 RepID=UPI00109E413B|nr:LysM peptidoglycan-binding domain-containing protein [Streptomyces sp. A1136]THA49415.1 LysM peptidoglycan-binding domain-containing protein [Streptomyces sp. A1136]
MPKPATVRKPPPRQRSGAQSAAALVRGLLSLTALAALLAGLPVLLWWASAIVGPPGLAALSQLLSTDDSGQVFLLALAVAGWAGWALFACAVLVEIPAQLRGRAAPQIRGLVGQRAAAALVGTVLLALPAGTALAVPATASPAPVSPVSVSAAPVPGTSPTIHAPATDHSADAAQYTVRDVRPAESLWSIAEQVLGDGERWTDIAALNEGHTMTDGTVFRADQPIQPGWALTLPADATPPPSTGVRAQGEHGTAAATAADGSQYTVREGDSLSSIAGEQLGDVDRYPEIFGLNKGTPLPDGGTFTDPNLIYPGQQLTLHTPPVATAPTVTPSPAAQAPDAPTKPTPPATPTPKPTPTPTATPGAPSSTSTSVPATPSPSTAKQAPTASTPTAQTAKPSAPPAANSPTASSTTASPTVGAPHVVSAANRINWVLIAGIGTLLTASLAGALGVRRILQQRARRAGETIAQDDDPTTIEQVLGALAQPQGVELLDHVLRALAHHAAADQEALPALRGARLSGDGIMLLLDEPADPITPFTAGPDTRTWVLDDQAVLPAAGELADVHAPYPGLVTLGADDDGLLLADLTTCRVLLLDGSAEEILEVGRALALELGTSRWTDYVEILTCGLGSRLSGLLPQGRIRTMPHLSAVAADLGELLVEAHQSGEQVLPWLMIGAADHGEEDVALLADALASARHLQTAVVLPATPPARRAFPHAEILDVTRDQTTVLAPLESPVTLQRVTDEQYRQYVHTLQVSVQDPEPAAGAWEFAESHQQPAASGLPLTVRVTSQDAHNPGNPFPALLAELAPDPVGPATSTSHDPDADADSADQPDVEAAAAAARANGAVALPHQAGAQEPGTQSQPEPADSDSTTGEVRIDMLGPLRITGGTGAAHAPRTTAVAALIHLRPGRSAEYLCKAVDPVNPWSTRTLHSRLSEIRAVFGDTPDGQPLLPRPKNGSYTFHRSVTSDWAQFRALASRGLAAGPTAGIADLEAAMALVRGKPFDGRTPPWADVVIQEMLSRITDTAHTLARWHTDGDTPDLDAARRTVLQALDVEETSELLYRDLLNIEWTAGNTYAVRMTVGRLQQMARTYDISLDDRTEDTIHRVLSENPPVTQHVSAS